MPGRRKGGYVSSQSIISPRQALSKRFARSLGHWWPLYLMMLPGILYFAVYKFAPMYGAIIAFKDYSVRKGITGSPWASPWFKYFQEFFKSPANTRVIANTLSLSFWKLLMGMFPSLIFALAVSECRSRRFARVVQTVSYLPHFLSWVVVYGICIAMLSESSGVLNKLIQNLGHPPVPFLTSNDYFQGTLVATDVWKGVGWGAITYLAAIMGIDQTLYEAATVDGCGRFRQIFYITLPCIRKVFVVLMILKVGNILDAGFNQVYIMMTDEVKMSGEIIDTWIYTRGLGRLNYSLATAVGLLKSVLSFLMVFGTNKLARKWESAIW